MHAAVTDKKQGKHKASTEQSSLSLSNMFVAVHHASELS